MPERRAAAPKVSSIVRTIVAVVHVSLTVCSRNVHKRFI